MIPIDRIICLSLSHRTDRRERLKPQVDLARNLGILPPESEVPLEFFDAFRPATCLVPASFAHLPSYYATNLGHIRILEKLWLEGSNHALILEDDALFTEHFYAKGQETYDRIATTRPDWLAIFWGGHECQTRLPVDDLIAINRGSLQSHAYSVNRHGIYRLYDHLWCDHGAVCDWGYMHMMRADHCVFSPRHWQITTAEGHSDNLNAWKSQGT